MIYAPDGTITGVRHAWTFDDMFSTYALQGIEAKVKGAYSREELGPLAQTNVESLKEFGFFTFAKADGTKEKFLEPVDYFLEYRDSLLTLHFTLPVKSPFKAKQLTLEVFDRAFFIDFKYADGDAVKLVGAPADCRMQFQRPNDGTASAQKLGEQNFSEGGQLWHDVRQQDHGGLSMSSDFRPNAVRTLATGVLVLAAVLTIDSALHVLMAQNPFGGPRPPPPRRRPAVLSGGFWQSSRNSIARFPRPSAPRNPTARRSGRCSRSRFSMASFTPPGPATARP